MAGDGPVFITTTVNVTMLAAPTVLDILDKIAVVCSMIDEESDFVRGDRVEIEFGRGMWWDGDERIMGWTASVRVPVSATQT